MAQTIRRIAIVFFVCKEIEIYHFSARIIFPRDCHFKHYNERDLKDIRLHLKQWIGVNMYSEKNDARIMVVENIDLFLSHLEDTICLDLMSKD